MTEFNAPDRAVTRDVVTSIPGPRSQALHVRRRRAVARGVGSALGAYMESAGPGLLHDVDGNTFIDLCSGLGVTGVGNAAPEVAGAVREQAERITHTCFLATPYEGYVAVCEELAEVTPGTHEKRSALFSTGAEAVENAVKAARGATGRTGIVVLDHAYHGRTNLAMGLSSRNTPYKQGFGPFTPDIHRIPASYPFRDPDRLSGEETARRALEVLDRQVGGENVAALVLEPILGEGGFIVPAPGYLPALARWCAEHGVLLVADEVQSGFCRTGAWFASEHEQVVPDIVATAKGIAGGLPLAAVTGRAEIMDAVRAGGFGGTFGGNPVACAAALASIDLMRRRDLAGAAREIERVLVTRLGEFAARYEVIGEVRGRGAMIGVELVRPGTLEPDPALAQRVVEACHAQGVFLLTVGTYGNVLRFLPPLVIPHALLDDGLDVLDKSLAQVLG